MFCKKLVEISRSGQGTEAGLAQIIYTAMIPRCPAKLAFGGNSRWSTSALPRNPVYMQPISAPKPDWHIGYCEDDEDFSTEAMSVVHHHLARKYTMPATGTILPFITVELKSEGTGGTLLHARYQAASSGTCAVESVRWLYKQANVFDSKITDSVAFSLCANGTVVELSIHWFSPEKRCYYMSRLKTFVTAEGEDV
ncbi:MAG: hypothetical protein GOMPHAMPRED_000295 [Gomphillus americanus]|uniref:DUF7924 domain-containing protein n=1 Tax=Gomphillus americanus TaxID=1940652 RepID=A0A8H3EDX1_9LECA|nr:MAG: hypothetical protein GOMPHAMPRED_000295 [Gomphillus americanus]